MKNTELIEQLKSLTDEAKRTLNQEGKNQFYAELKRLLEDGARDRKSLH